MHRILQRGYGIRTEKTIKKSLLAEGFPKILFDQDRIQNGSSERFNLKISFGSGACIGAGSGAELW